MLRLQRRRDDPVADGVPGTDDGALHMGADVHVELVRDARRRVPLLGRIVLSCGRRLVRVRRLRLNELRVLLRRSDDGAERFAHLTTVCSAEPAPDRDASSDTRAPEAVRPLLPRPHKRANFRALAAPDDGGAERGPDASADSGPDAGTNVPAVAPALVRAGAAPDSEPVYRTEPGAVSRSVTRARVRTHGEPDAVAQLHAELGAVAVPVRGTVAESESGPDDCADATAKHAGALSGYVSAHVDDAAHGRADSETEPVSYARSHDGGAHVQSDWRACGGRALHHARGHRVR